MGILHKVIEAISEVLWNVLSPPSREQNLIQYN